MATPKPDVTILAKASDPLTPTVVQYMNEHSGCNVTTKYVDEDEGDSKKKEKYPQILVGEKYFGGVECLDKFPLEVSEFRMMEVDGRIDEPMCREEREFDRFILSKTQHEWADMYTLYKKELSSFWVTSEVPFTDDLEHWNNLKPDERHFISHILAFFASLDQMVQENISCAFGQEIVVPQVRAHFAAQEAMETVHGECYALLIETLIKDRQEQAKLLQSIQTMPIIAKKAKWALQYMDADKVSLAERIVAFVCLEGVMFSGAFCSIFWLKSRGLMPGLCFANALIARDEGLHAEASVMIYLKLQTQLPESRVHEIFRDAVDVEREFICESLPVALIGINSKEMARYIEHVADFWLVRLGYTKLYHSNNPFGWMITSVLQGKSSFFETKVSEYARANVLTVEEEQGFSLDTDF